MSTKRCPVCGDEFIESVRRCPDCAVLLTTNRDDPAGSTGADQPASESVDGSDVDGVGLVPDQRGDQLVYALNEWSGEERMLAEQLLASNEIPRVWEGTNLVVPSGARDITDAVVAQAAGWANAGLDPEAPKLVYELGEWADREVTRLTEGLDEVGIAHEFTYEGDLVVLEDDEERIEALLDSIEFPDALDADLDADAASGLDIQQALSDLFVAVDRLRKHARNADGVLGVVGAARTIADMDVPFGFAPAVWRDIVAQASTLRESIEGDDEPDERIEERAEELRSLLRDYV